MRQVKITESQSKVIQVLVENASDVYAGAGEVVLSDVAEELSVDDKRVPSIVKTLVKKRLVEQDKKSKVLSLSTNLFYLVEGWKEEVESNKLPHQKLKVKIRKPKKVKEEKPKSIDLTLDKGVKNTIEATKDAEQKIIKAVGVPKKVVAKRKVKLTAEAGKKIPQQIAGKVKK